MTASTDPRVQSIIETIDTCLAQAERLPGTAAHDAVFDTVPALKARINATLAGDAQAEAQALGHLAAMFEHFKQRRPVARLPYSPLLDGRYPFRDATHRPVHIVAVSDGPDRFGACEDPRREAVLPFVDPDAGEAGRGRPPPGGFNKLRRARQKNCVCRGGGGGKIKKRG
ncbi:hypothetical protein ACEN88_32170, partial [Massilia sp. CT11-108]|uniref:hypothetical protein n=1 Tax=Massilia sp. CT11-108 TaxID=3393900 RepID=UPI0039A406A6